MITRNPNSASTSTFNLAIVGHAQDKFTPETESLARATILEQILLYTPATVISGGCHLGGVDIYAEEIANNLGIPTTIYKPKTLSWYNGYRDRNNLIARNSTLTLVIVVKHYPPTYTGRRFPNCYHCKGRNPEQHVKSGGCWTAWKSRNRKWVVI